MISKGIKTQISPQETRVQSKHRLSFPIELAFLLLKAFSCPC